MSEWLNAPALWFFIGAFAMWLAMLGKMTQRRRAPSPIRLDPPTREEFALAIVTLFEWGSTHPDDALILGWSFNDLMRMHRDRMGLGR